MFAKTILSLAIFTPAWGAKFMGKPPMDGTVALAEVAQQPVGGCAGTQHGCCPNTVEAKVDAAGSNCNLVVGCAGTTYGCCSNGIEAKNDAAGSNCRPACALTVHGCCPSPHITTKKADVNGTNCPGYCLTTTFGCCTYSHEFGECCMNGTEARVDQAGSNCPKAQCVEDQHGCCPNSGRPKVDVAGSNCQIDSLNLDHPSPKFQAQFDSAVAACDYCRTLPNAELDRRHSKITETDTPRTADCKCMAIPGVGNTFKTFCDRLPVSEGYVAREGGCKCNFVTGQVTTCEALTVDANASTPSFDIKTKQWVGFQPSGTPLASRRRTVRALSPKGTWPASAGR